MANKKMTPAERIAALHNSTAAPPVAPAATPAFSPLHVTNTIGEWKEGDTLSSPAIAEKYFREAVKVLKAGNDEDPELVDGLDSEQVMAAILHVKGDNADANNKRILAIDALAPASEPLADMREGVRFGNQHAEALNLGAKLDKQTAEHFNKLADGKEMFDGSTLLLAADLDRIYKDAEGNDLTEGWPIPNTWPAGTKNTKGNKIVLPEGNANVKADHWESGKARGSWYADVLDGSEWGAPIARVVGIFQTANREKRTLTDVEQKEIREKTGETGSLVGKASKKSIERRWVNRRNNAIGKLRLAQRLRLQMKAAKEVPHIFPQYVEQDIALAATKKFPLKLSYIKMVDGKPVESDESTALSIQQFVNYDFAEAVKYVEGGMKPLEAIEKTAEREPQTDKASYVRPTKDQAWQYIIGLDWFLGSAVANDRTANLRALHSILMEGDEGPRNRDLFDKFYVAVRDVHRSIQKQLDKDQEQKAKAAA